MAELDTSHPLYKLGWSDYRKIAAKLFDAVESGEIDAPPMGDTEQATQLVRLVIKALVNGKRSISDAEAAKWAHVAYEPEERKAVFVWVKNYLATKLGITAGIDNEIEGKQEIFSLAAGTRNFGFKGRTNKKSIAVNDRVKAKSDIAIKIPKGSQGVIENVVSTDTASVKLQGGDFTKPVIIPVKVLKPSEGVGPEEQGTEQGQEGEQTARGKESGSSKQQNAEKQSDIAQEASGGSGQQEQVAASLKLLVSRKIKLAKGDTVMLSKEVKVVIPEGTMGVVKSIVSNKEVEVLFRGRDLAIQEGIEIPTKLVEKIQTGR